METQNTTDAPAPVSPSAIIIDKLLPGIDRQATARIVAFFSDMTCGENCWKAKEDVCKCECGGKNHGIQLRGGNGIRACKINGYRYELHSVGKRRDLLEIVENLIREDDVARGVRKIIDGAYHSWSTCASVPHWFKTSHVHPTEYNRGGAAYVLKYASLSQCLKWKELEYFGVADDRDRYNSDAAILWKRCDTPSYLAETEVSE